MRGGVAQAAVTNTLKYLCGLCCVLLIFYAVAASTASIPNDPTAPLVNWIGPVCVALGFTFGAARVVAADYRLVWTPIPWFLAAAAAYCGVGPLLMTFGVEEAVSYVSYDIGVTDADINRTNLLNAVGILSTLVAIGLAACSDGRGLDATRGYASANPSRAIWPAFLLLFSVGVVIKYAVVIPYIMGKIPYIVPGAVLSLQNCLPLSILLLALLSVTKGGGWSFLLWAVVIFEAVSELLLFNKTGVITVFAMVGVGSYVGSRNLKTLIRWGVIACIVYLLIGPFTAHCRVALTYGERTYDEATLEERLQTGAEVLDDLIAGREMTSSLQQGWWIRLCYVTPQIVVMRQYDDHSPGDSLSLAFAAPIPRFLWPEKPRITDVGGEVTYLMVGHRKSSTGIGIYAEAYWNGGWMAVIGCGAFMGIALGVISRLSLSQMDRQEWALLPCVMLGIRMAYRIDGYFAPDYVGSLAIYACYLALFRLSTGSPLMAQAPRTRARALASRP